MTGKKRLKLLRDWLLSPFIDGERFDMNDWPTCAVGEGTRLAPLVNDGLKMEYDEPVYKGARGMEAVSDFFDIDNEAAKRVFGVEPRTPKMVAKQIDGLLKKR